MEWIDNIRAVQLLMDGGASSDQVDELVRRLYPECSWGTEEDDCGVCRVNVNIVSSDGTLYDVVWERESGDTRVTDFDYAHDEG